MRAKTKTYDDVKAGCLVTFLVYAGRGANGVKEYREKTGRAVMLGPAGWVINGGGPQGTPHVCDRDNFVRVR